MPPEPPPGVAQPSIMKAALGGACPRCGARTLYKSGITFADRCSACGLDFTTFNVGDGPAAFLTLIIGTVVTALAIWLELGAHPPFWVHVAVWVPLTIAAVVFGLRGAKAALLAAEYRRRAGQVVSDNADDEDEAVT